MASDNFETIFNTFLSETSGENVDNSEDYQEICSFLTVQSNSKGFFKKFYLEVRDLFVKEGKLNNFGKLASNKERISLLFNDEPICSLLLSILENVKPVFKAKDLKLSQDCRMDSEKLYLLGHIGNVKNHEKLEKALRLANIAVMRAPFKGDDGKVLAATLISRGHILLALENGIAALNDFKFAADVSPTAKKTTDYYALLARCYLYTNDMRRAEISLNIAEKLSNGSSSEIQLCREEMLKYRNTAKEETNADAGPPTVPVYTPMLAKGEHAEWKGASSLVELTENAKQGRFMIAGSNISTGDVVLSEEPFAAYLSHTHFGNYCHHCFEKLTVPIPCMNCSGVAFCSVKCMRASCDTYHRYECEYMDLLIGSGMSILCMLALKIFTQSPSIAMALQASVLLYNDLCVHLGERTMDDHLQRSLMATFLMRCLQKSGYFGQRKTENPKPSELELAVCVHLYGLLQVLQYNTHEIHHNHCDDNHHIVDNSRTIYIGAGIYRTGSYFNHECWPTVARHFYGSRLTLTAIKPHTPGTVIAENYGPIFTKQDLKLRRLTLKARYLFDCNCLPCLKEWPPLEQLRNSVRWRCCTPNCVNTFTLCKGGEFQTVTCAVCRKKWNFTTNMILMEKVEEWYAKAAECMAKQKINQAMELFKTALDAFFDIAVLPHKNTILAQLSFIKCLSVSQIQMN